MKPFDENYDIDDFISGVDLLKKWKIDKFALFHYISYHRRHSLPELPGQIDTSITGHVDPLMSFLEIS